jgi:putative DNA primase/helicase
MAGPSADLTWCIEAIDVLPLLAITSPDKRCGKTRLLTLIGGLVRRPLSTSTISDSTLYRSSEKWRPTILVDEFDSSGTGNENLRNVLNSGHTKK